MDGNAQYNPRTVEEVFKDFKGRRAGMIKALTTGILIFFIFRGLIFLGFFDFEVLIAVLLFLFGSGCRC